MLALGASIICDWVMYENDAKQALPLQCEELRFEARELIGADAAGSKERGCRNRRIDAHQGDLPSYSGIGKDRADRKSVVSGRSVSVSVGSGGVSIVKK